MASGFNTAEGLAADAVPTAPTSGGASGTALSAISVAAGDEILVKAAAAMHGSRGYQMVFSGPGGGATRILWSIADSARVVFSTYYYLDTLPTAIEDVMGVRNSTGTMGILIIAADGKLQMTNATGAGIAASKASATVPVAQKFRIDMVVKKGTTTTDGTLGYAYYLGDSDTPEFTWESAAQNAGTTDSSLGFIGRSTGRTQAHTVRYDTIRWETKASGFLTHYEAPGAPTITMLGQNTAEGIAVGATPSAGNSGGVSGTALEAVLIATGDAITVSDFKTVHGSRGFELDLAAAGAGATRLQWGTNRADRVVLSFYMGEITTLPTAIEDIAGWRNGTGYMGILIIAADGKLQMTNATGAGIAASKAPSVFPIQQKVRIEISAVKGTGTTDGTLGYAYFLGNSATPVFSWESNAVNAGTTNAQKPFLGRTTGRAQAHKLYFDTVRWAAVSAGWLDPYVAPPAAPIVELGPDLTAVEPWSTVGISAAGSRDSDNAIASYDIEQTGGTTTVTLAGVAPEWTYTAPALAAGDILTFEVTATDVTSLTSLPATVTHTILQANEFAVVSGALFPVRLTNVKN